MNCQIARCGKTARARGLCWTHYSSEKRAGTLAARATRQRPRSVDFAEWFWLQTDRTSDSGCWLWTRNKARNGYGCVKFRGRDAVATRVAWELSHSTSPGAAFVCHRCDNPPCVNPAHLFLGDNGDNVADMVAKGRMPRGSGRAFAKLTEEQALEARRRCAAGERQLDVAASLGVAQQTISQLVSGKTWRHAGVRVEITT